MDNKQQTKDAHNAIAQKYYELYKDDKTDLIYFDNFLEMCKNKILDLGCGMGHYSNYMYNKGFEVTGIDFSEEMIKIAQNNNSDINFLVSDICDLNVLQSQKYNGIVIAYVLQHLSKNEVNELFNNLKNYLEKDAMLLLFLREGESVLEEEEPIDTRFKYIINEYTEDEIKLLLNNNGWETIKIEKKKYIEDPNSLAPNTLVVLAKYKNC